MTTSTVALVRSVGYDRCVVAESSRQVTVANVLRAAVSEVDSLAGRRAWTDQDRREVHALLAMSASGNIGPREIAERFRAVARSMGRADRAKTWQTIRRVAGPGLRALLDSVYRNRL